MGMHHGPYGRRQDSAPLIEDPGQGTSYTHLPASWFDGTRAIPMPRGGYRYLASCPLCARWVKTLYLFDGGWQCRHCAGLRYPSQYSGRRPEASPERLLALVESALKARKPGTFAKRMGRFAVAEATYNQREMARIRHVTARPLFGKKRRWRPKWRKE